MQKWPVLVQYVLSLVYLDFVMVLLPGSSTSNNLRVHNVLDFLENCTIHSMQR